MLKKTVTYTDYNGVERTEDFYFNLSKAEVTEMELSVDGGLAQMLENIVNSKDNKEIIRTFKQIVLKAYGENHQMEEDSSRVRNYQMHFLRQKHTAKYLWN